MRSYLRRDKATIPRLPLSSGRERRWPVPELLIRLIANAPQPNMAMAWRLVFEFHHVIAVAVPEVRRPGIHDHARDAES
jgi:hypothetical protein